MARPRAWARRLCTDLPTPQVANETIRPSRTAAGPPSAVGRPLAPVVAVSQASAPAPRAGGPSNQASFGSTTAMSTGSTLHGQVAPDVAIRPRSGSSPLPRASASQPPSHVPRRAAARAVLPAPHPCAQPLHHEHPRARRGRRRCVAARASGWQRWRTPPAGPPRGRGSCVRLAPSEYRPVAPGRASSTVWTSGR